MEFYVDDGIAPRQAGDEVIKSAYNKGEGEIVANDMNNMNINKEKVDGEKKTDEINNQNKDETKVSSMQNGVLNTFVLGLP